MFSAVTTSLVLICVRYVNPVDVMLWKGWQSRELVWECKATQDFPTIIAPTILLSCCHCPIILLSYYHCPHHLTITITILLSLPQLSYYPAVIAPLYIWTPLKALKTALHINRDFSKQNTTNYGACDWHFTNVPFITSHSQVNISLGGVTSVKSAE